MEGGRRILNYPTQDNFPNPAHLSYFFLSLLPRTKWMLQAGMVLMVFFFPSLPLAPLTEGRTAEASGASSCYHFTGCKVTASPGTNAGRHNWMWPAAKQLPGATVDCSCHQVEFAAEKYGPEECGSGTQLRTDGSFTAAPPTGLCLIIVTITLLSEHRCSSLESSIIFPVTRLWKLNNGPGIPIFWRCIVCFSLSISLFIYLFLIFFLVENLKWF